MTAVSKFKEPTLLNNSGRHVLRFYLNSFINFPIVIVIYQYLEIFDFIKQQMEDEQNQGKYKFKKETNQKRERF